MKQAKLFGNAEYFMHLLEKYPIAMHNHHQGVSLERFMKTERLTEFFYVLAINNDRYFGRNNLQF